MTAASEQKLTWDWQNQMVACDYSGHNVAYVYGADGLRRHARFNDVDAQGTKTLSHTVDYHMDGAGAARSIRKTSAGAETVTTWFLGPNGPLYQRTGNGEPTWNVYDGLGSVIGTVDASNSTAGGNQCLLTTRQYDAFGAVRGWTGSLGGPHRYVGALGHPQDDETGLLYMRARYMDPEVGRFMSEDPAGEGNNWYVYCDRDPVNRFDANGQKSSEIQALGLYLINLAQNLERVMNFGPLRSGPPEREIRFLFGFGCPSRISGRAPTAPTY